jgi:hypothetical protein
MQSTKENKIKNAMHVQLTAPSAAAIVGGDAINA